MMFINLDYFQHDMLNVLAVLCTRQKIYRFGNYGPLFLITKRSYNKSYKPGYFEIPGGGAIAGETSKQAIIREVMEEVSVDVSSCDHKLLFSYFRDDVDGTGNYIVDVHEFIVDAEILANSASFNDEVIAGYLVTKEQLIIEFDESCFLHYNSLMKLNAFDT